MLTFLTERVIAKVVILKEWLLPTTHGNGLYALCGSSGQRDQPLMSSYEIHPISRNLMFVTAEGGRERYWMLIISEMCSKKALDQSLAQYRNIINQLCRIIRLDIGLLSKKW